MGQRQEKIAGILGGMGPEATVDLMRRIIKATPAQDDVDHIRCIVDNNPKVPSRLKALLEGGGEAPGPAMAEMARKLELWGADFLCIACNTAHNYYPDVRDAVKIPVLNMVELATDAAVKAAPEARAVGILASPAVRMTRLYADALAARNLEAVYPDPEAEENLLALIRRIKCGDSGQEIRKSLAGIVGNLQGKGVPLAMAACTELGIVMEDERYGIHIVDAAQALAQEVVRVAKQTAWSILERPVHD